MSVKKPNPRAMMKCDSMLSIRDAEGKVASFSLDQMGGDQLVIHRTCKPSRFFTPKEAKDLRDYLIACYPLKARPHEVTP